MSVMPQLLNHEGGAVRRLLPPVEVRLTMGEDVPQQHHVGPASSMCHSAAVAPANIPLTRMPLWGKAQKVVDNNAAGGAGYVLFPDGLSPQLHVVPRIPHPSEVSPPRPHQSGEQRPNKFHFFHPVRKEHDTSRFVLEELSPVTGAPREEMQAHAMQGAAVQRSVQRKRGVRKVGMARRPPASQNSCGQEQHTQQREVVPVTTLNVSSVPPVVFNSPRALDEDDVVRSLQTGGEGGGASNPLWHNIPIESVMSAIPTNSPAPNYYHSGGDASMDEGDDGGEVAVSLEQITQKPSTTGVSPVRGTNGCYVRRDDDRVRLLPPHGHPPNAARHHRRRHIPLDTSPSPESQHHQNQFRRIATECKQVESDHMAARRRRKIEHRSFEHYENLHRKHADDWNRVCDSTLELQQDRHAIALLYDGGKKNGRGGGPTHKKWKRNKKGRVDVLVPPAGVHGDVVVAIGPVEEEGLSAASPDCPNSDESSYNGDADDGCGTRPPPHVSATLVAQRRGQEPRPAAVYETESSVLAGPGNILPPLPQQVRHPSLGHCKDNNNKAVRSSYDFDASPPIKHHAKVVDGESSGGVRRSTQDVIAAMERRYQLMMERDNQRAMKQFHEDERNHRRLDDQLLEARHVVHQSMARERRRDEARKKADQLAEERRSAIEHRIADREMNTKYNNWRKSVAAGAGGPRVGGALSGFSNIARRNEELIHQ